jgi:hypothetical protein
MPARSMTADHRRISDSRSDRSAGVLGDASIPVPIANVIRLAKDDEPGDVSLERKAQGAARWAKTS